MELIKSVTELIASILIFLGSIIAVISTIGIAKFQDVFLRSHASMKGSALSVLPTLIGILIYFTTVQSSFSVRLLLSIVFINLTSTVGMHLVARAAYRTRAYIYRKDDAPRQSSILLSSKEFNTREGLRSRAKKKEEQREKLHYDIKNHRAEERKQQDDKNIEDLEE